MAATTNNKGSPGKSAQKVAKQGSLLSSVKEEDQKLALLNMLEDLHESMKNMADLKQIDRLKTEFLSITSHELKSPITPIKVQLEMLRAQDFGPLNGEQKESIGVILRNVDRLTTLIDDILDFSRIEKGKLKMVPEKVDPNKIVQEAFDMIKPKAEKAKLHFEITLKKVPLIIADPARLRQVIVNLLNNAVKFTKKGKIVLTTELSGKEVVISIADTGIGIEKKYLAELFSPFYQIQGSFVRHFGGIGLGLAICKGIVTAHGGRILVTSKVGVGSTFVVWLPVKGSLKVGMYEANILAGKS